MRDQRIARWFSYTTRLDVADVLLGSFLVMRPAVVATADTAALGRVVEPELEDALLEVGYPRDPHLKVYTGFYVTPDLYPMPPARPPPFPGRNALVNLDVLDS